MRENAYQAKLITKISEMFPGSIILKNDANYRQGIPDLLVLFNDRWAALEVKRSSKANIQPNQKYYVSKMNEMSFSSFIYPENESEVLDALQRAFSVSG